MPEKVAKKRAAGKEGTSAEKPAKRAKATPPPSAVPAAALKGQGASVVHRGVVSALGKSLPRFLKGESDEELKRFKEEALMLYDDVKFFVFETITQLLKRKTDSQFEVPTLRKQRQMLKRMEYEESQGTSGGVNTEDVLVLRRLVFLLHNVTPWRDAEREPNFYFAQDWLGSEAENEESKKVATTGQSVVARVQRSNSHTGAFQTMWTHVLSLPLPSDSQLVVLDSVRVGILPFLNNAHLLCDFLYRSFEFGGLYSLLALDSLFVLIVEHNLEYAGFFAHLYALLSPDLLCVEAYRNRFLGLLEEVLTRSTLLSASLVAAFVKRCCRLCLGCPTPVARFLLALSYQLLLKHPEVMQLIHRSPNTMDDDEVEMDPKDDPFLPDEIDPLKSNAIRSTCWEVVHLQHHCNPSVALLARQFGHEFSASRVRELGRQSLLKKGYKELFESELSRERGQVATSYGAVTFDFSFPGVHL